MCNVTNDDIGIKDAGLPNKIAINVIFKENVPNLLNQSTLNYRVKLGKIYTST